MTKNSGEKNLLLSIIKFCFLLLLLVLQFLIIYFLYKGTKLFSIYMDAAFGILCIGAVLYIIYKNINSAYKIVWIVFIMLFPVAGLLFYILFGNPKMPKKSYSKVSNIIESTNRFLPKNETIYRNLKSENSDAYKQAEYLYNTSLFPMYKNSKVEYLNDGEKYFLRLLKDLQNAKKYIFLEYFIISKSELWDEIFEILDKKSKEGVRIFIMTDEIGSLGRIPKGFKNAFANSKIETTVFNSLKPILSSKINYRNHRKIAVIDGDIAYTGGINIGDEYTNEVQKYGHWKDVGIRITGEAVNSFVVMFIRMWNFSSKNKNLQIGRFIQKEHSKDGKGFVIPYADGPSNTLNPARNIYLQMISNAKKSVWIMTPYLILDDEIVTALVNSSLSGVDVKIITPHIPDKKLVFACTRSFYKELLEAGVHIYEYKMGFVHAKTCLIDGVISTVGTINFDFRSLYLNYECGAWMYKTGVELSLKRDFTNVIQDSIEIKLNSWKRCSFLRKIYESILRVISPLL